MYDYQNTKQNYIDELEFSEKLKKNRNLLTVHIHMYLYKNRLNLNIFFLHCFNTYLYYFVLTIIKILHTLFLLLALGLIEANYSTDWYMK